MLGTKTAFKSLTWTSVLYPLPKFCLWQGHNFFLTKSCIRVVITFFIGQISICIYVLYCYLHCVGGFAFVFVAQDLKDGKEYALKVCIHLHIV